MRTTASFARFASICCFITVITTIGIHLWFPDPPADFEQRVLLFRDKTYLLNRWWIIVHCLLVIISMWGMALLLKPGCPGFAPLGFLFFAVFSIVEISRQMLVLFYFNGLREQYFLATDPATKEVLKHTLSTAGLIAAPLFGVFIFAFALGNLFYGLSLFRERDFDKILSLLLIFWSAGNFLALGNEFWRNNGISSFLEYYSFTYQPFMRLVIGIWLWKKANGHELM